MMGKSSLRTAPSRPPSPNYPFKLFPGHLGLFLILISAEFCNSDFNVVIPEICQLRPNVPLNLTWIQEMVHLGIRDEANRVSINILRSEEICDGSEGLLKFISMTYSDPSGTMISSLESHFCPTAASACQLKLQPFISWTCPKIPGVISLKPETSEVVGATQRLISYFNWKKIAFVKLRADGSSFCDELGIELQELYFRHPEENASLVILGNYEDLDQMQVYSSIANSIDNLILCVSYSYGFRVNLVGTTEEAKGHINPKTKGTWRLRRPVNLFGRVPLVLLPEWPLPMEIFRPEVSTLGLITNPYPFPPSSPASFDLKLRSHWERRRNSFEEEENHFTPATKIIETLLAQLILKSVRIGLETSRAQSEDGSVRVPVQTTERNNGVHFPSNFYRQPPHHSPKLSFYFSLSQFEEGRWHPLINLSNGDNPLGRQKTEKSPPSRTLHNNKELTSIEVLSWVQVLVATFILALIILTVVGLSVYARHHSHDSFYGSIQRKMSRRQRSQGPYKILLTSNDIAFGSLGMGIGNEDLRRKLGAPHFNCTVSGGPGEKPDLLKVPHGPLRKNSSASNLAKTDSVSFPGDNKARYKGDLVHLRKLGESLESVQIKTKAMTVLENLNGLRHENVVAMLGCLTEPVPALVWEYCSRGSLHEILQQNDIKLDWAFKLSLLTDLVRGMRYLHLSFVKVHGLLTSHNCVVDARWVLKITDYGLNGLYAAQGLSPTHMKPKALLWTAPELLRDETLRKQGTQAGDIYSFGIIMQEVLVRGEPYCMVNLTPSEILEKLKHPPPLIRPSVSKGAAPPEAINIMRQCWGEQPDMRPDFVVIHDLFKTLNHGRKANIVDTMFQMLEKYSNNLEELIRERTEQLDLEKKKTEQLLNRMLPSMVADKLKLGLPVDPEEFSDVTIYFSDIVGFTTISAYSTPFEVVDLLNDLYTCFDATINDYNVYKVETIGDAYMVVGGAPVWSRDHADQIATMALDLLHQSGKFRIRHLPYTPLRLRIGLHTGPCCAGVVGLTMPRYCLFGDTVNTASRMESTGSAWRIHISGETKAKLDSIGGYIMNYRGMTAIKGKGQMPTFWLLGKEGFDKELPKSPAPTDPCYLDEKAIIYGRTGKWPESAEIGNEFADPSSMETGSSSGVKETVATSPPQAGKPATVAKAKPKYGMLSGAGCDSIRSLSPAEQVAHALLNGKTAVRGLRRQFSLDQGTVHPLDAKTSFRKAPSLEESSEYIYSNSCSGSFDREWRDNQKEKLSQALGHSLPSSSTVDSQSIPKIATPRSSIIETSENTIEPKLIPTPHPLLKTRALTILEESPIQNRKSTLTKNNSSKE